MLSDQSWRAQFLTKGKLVHSRTLLEDVTQLKVREHILGFVTWKEVPCMDVIDQPLSSFILRIDPSELLPTQGGGSSRHRLLEEEILSPNFGAASSSLHYRNNPEAYDLLAVVPSF